MIDLILDECLNDIRAGRATLAECLAKYPDQAEELAPLLELGSALTQVSDVLPSPAFQQATRARLLQLPQQPVQRERPRPFFTLFAMPPMRIAAAALVVLIALVGFTSGAVAASSDSLPGSILYPVKRAAEQVQLVLATDPASQANVHLQIANDRLDETVALSESGQDQLAQQTLDEYNTELGRTLEIIAVQSNRNPASIENLAQGLIKQQEKLRGIKNPRAEQEILRRALSISENALEKIAPRESATPTAQPVLSTPGQSVTPTLPSVISTPSIQSGDATKETPSAPATIDTTDSYDKGKPSDVPKSTLAPDPATLEPFDRGRATDAPRGKPTPKK